MRNPALINFAALFLPIAAFGAGLPDYFTLPPSVSVHEIAADEAYGEADFPLPEQESNIKQGHHWQGSLVMKGVADDTAGKAMWERVRPVLAKSGWKVAAEFDANPMSATLHLTEGRDAWATIAFFAPDDIQMHLVEVGVSKLTFKIPAPGKKPETVDPESGDFPYLPPLPGSKFSSGSKDEVPLQITLHGQEEPTLVGASTIAKSYEPPQGVANLEFVTAYREALKAAGWDVVDEMHGVGTSDASVSAHYARDGRDIWAHLHYGAEGLSMRVADMSKRDDAKTLRTEKHLRLDGVFFDFNKATLKPQSETGLARACDALKANPDVAVEVQGHTDNVGGDDYNQKLSESRAQAVMAWFVAHGVPADRLSAKGYGKTQPVAENDTDEGRARNRRVELVCGE